MDITLTVDNAKFYVELARWAEKSNTRCLPSGY